MAPRIHAQRPGEDVPIMRNTSGWLLYGVLLAVPAGACAVAVFAGAVRLPAS
jgi:hypothetical protein